MRAIPSLFQPARGAALLAAVGAAEHGLGVVFVAGVTFRGVDFDWNKSGMSRHGCVLFSRGEDCVDGVNMLKNVDCKILGYVARIICCESEVAGRWW